MNMKSFKELNADFDKSRKLKYTTIKKEPSKVKRFFKLLVYYLLFPFQ